MFSVVFDQGRNRECKAIVAGACVIQSIFHCVLAYSLAHKARNRANTLQDVSS